jgi:hypothetical protein
LLLGAAAPARAQFVVRTWLPWRTIETRHFAFHYPLPLEAWTRHVAERADAIDSAVAQLVGYAPTAKTQVVVDNPYSTANGSAWPFLKQPAIYLWARLRTRATTSASFETGARCSSPTNSATSRT